MTIYKHKNINIKIYIQQIKNISLIIEAKRFSIKLVDNCDTADLKNNNYVQFQ